MLKKRGKTWWTHHTRPDGERVRRSLKTTDKSAAAILERELIHKAAMVSAGLADPYEAHKRRPLTGHLAEWKADLIARGNTERHARDQHSRAIAVFNGCATWPKIDAVRVQAWLHDAQQPTRDGDGLSKRTASYYAQAAGQFCRWMVKQRRAPDNPLAGVAVKDAGAEQTRPTRAFSDDDLVALFDATAKAPTRYGMTGPARSMLYRFATETGLRSSEIRSVRLCDLSLCAVRPP